MSVFLSTVLYVIAAAFYWLAFSLEILGDLALRLQLEITVEFLIIVTALVLRGYWGTLALVVSVCVIAYLEIGRRTPISLSLPWNETGSP